ncbi:MAG: LysR family transcriptional regulator [Alphaproteobacteria bacterium]
MGKFENLNSFITVAEQGSFSAAARKLNISAVAVAKQINNIEDLLNAQLFHRSTKNIYLSESGRLFYEKIKPAINEIYEAFQDFSLCSSQPNGELKILSTEYFAKNYIIPYTKNFLHRYSDINLNLEIADRVPNLENEKIDIVFGLFGIDNDKYIARKIFNTKYVLVASPKYFEQKTLPQKPIDLKDHFFIGHNKRIDNNLEFKDGCKVSIIPKLMVNDTYSMIDLALEGIGIIQIQYDEIKNFIQEGIFIEILPRLLDKTQSIYLYYKKQKYLPLKIRVFIDYMLQNVVSKSPNL